MLSTKTWDLINVKTVPEHLLLTLIWRTTTLIWKATWNSFTIRSFEKLTLKMNFGYFGFKMIFLYSFLPKQPSYFRGITTFQSEELKMPLNCQDSRTLIFFRWIFWIKNRHFSILLDTCQIKRLKGTFLFLNDNVSIWGVENAFELSRFDESWFNELTPSLIKI